MKYMKELIPRSTLKISVALVDELFGSDLLVNEEFTIMVLLGQIVELNEWCKKMAQLFSDPNSLSDESLN